MEATTQIWKLITKGDESAYEKMYFQYYRQFYVYGQNLTSHLSLIEDAIHEVMVYIWQNRADLDAIKNPGGYFFTFFKNLLISNLKKQQLMADHDTDLEPEESNPENRIVERELQKMEAERLSRAFDGLTERQFEAIFLRFYLNKSYEEVAASMGITVKATYKLMARSIAELKNKYLPFLFILFYRFI